VWIRPVRAADASELQRAFALLSERSRFRRFLTGTPHLTDSLAAYFTAIDHVDHEAYVALPEEHASDIVGVARYIRYVPEGSDADLAITVADAWHDRGLATTLLRTLSERALVVGVRRFRVEMMADNEPLLRLLRGAGLADEVVAGELASGFIDLG
jgi:acetyltransferase